jgi:hypothetical protein
MVLTNIVLFNVTIHLLPFHGGACLFIISPSFCRCPIIFPRIEKYALICMIFYFCSRVFLITNGTAHTIIPRRHDFCCDGHNQTPSNNSVVYTYRISQTVKKQLNKSDPCRPTHKKKPAMCIQITHRINPHVTITEKSNGHQLPVWSMPVTVCGYGHYFCDDKFVLNELTR